MRCRAAAIALAVVGSLAVQAAASSNSEACLSEIALLRDDLAADSRLLAKARGPLKEAEALCRDERIDEARALIEDVRAQAGLAMGQGR